MTFQFHLVRLKGMKTKDVNNTPFIFQFHLVRLKGPGWHEAPAPCAISIPFSTIKSRGQSNVCAIICQISIPFSTIKRDGMPAGWRSSRYFNSI